MNEKLVNETAKRYIQRSLWLIIAIALCCMAGLNYISEHTDSPLMAPELTVSVVYSVVVLYAYALSWKAVAKSSPMNLTKFYMAASALRMITAVMVIVVYCLIVRIHADIRNFIIMFIVFYLATLIYDVVYFAHVEKNHKTEK